MLGERHVLPSVKFSLKEVLVEGTFPEGTFLVAVENPICTENGNLKKALRGSFFPIPSQSKFPEVDPKCYEKKEQPGAIIPVKHGKILLHQDRKRTLMCITNKGDRAIQVKQPFLLRK